MELSASSAFGFSAFAVFIFFILSKLRTQTVPLKLPPGPPKLPLLGNLHQLLGTVIHHKLTELGETYGPIMHLQIGEVPAVIVSSPEIAKEVTTTHDINFARRPLQLSGKILTYNWTDIAFAPYGTYWRQLRKLCVTEVLSAKRVQTYRSIREEEVGDLVQEISAKAGTPVNMSAKIFSLTYGITARAAFGTKSKYQEEYIAIVMESSKAVGLAVCNMYPSSKLLPLITGFKHKLEKLHREADKILENIIVSHLKTKSSSASADAKEGLLDILLRIQETGNLEIPLTRDNIKSVIADVFTAGSETSSTTVEWAISEIVKNPRVMKKAQAEVREVYKGKESVDEERLDQLKYLKLIIKETLRLHPSLPLLLQRENASQCVIKGYDIPAGTRVMINVWAIARNPKYWKEPEKFVPERFADSPLDYIGTNFEYLPFGAGRRICPGIDYAMPNMLLPLAQLLYHFDWELPGGVRGEDLDMSESFGVTVRRKDDLYLVFKPHKHTNLSN
uniref:Cytochrome P450 n=1 Tax=Kalanchoe fedtschenkoi TaxID=63787 RepID=A0A7N0U259_KALFE